jgi:hypothetical protein
MMTLGNMRHNGVRTLAIYCGGRWCNHSATCDVSAYPDCVPVPFFGPRMVCTVCGAIGADARPNGTRETSKRQSRGRAARPSECPLLPESGQTIAMQRLSAKCQQQTSRSACHFRLKSQVKIETATRRLLNCCNTLALCGDIHGETRQTAYR